MGGRGREQRMRGERLEVSESLVEEMALEERNMVEDFKRVRWADLEDEEQSLRCEQMAEKKGIMNRSETAETLTETQAAAGQTGEQRRRERTTDGKCVPRCESDSRLGKSGQYGPTSSGQGRRRQGTASGEQRRGQGKASDGIQQGSRQEQDDDNEDDNSGGGTQQGGRQEQNDDNDETRQGAKQEERQKQGKGEGKQGLEELI